MALNFADKMDEVSKTIQFPEQILGKGLFQPFNNTNSGSRKILAGLQRDQIFSLIKPEKAIIETGYEIRFGDRSSSVIKTDADYQVIGKVSKFSFAPNHHYYLIFKDVKSNKLDVIERISYTYITESYGYLLNNEYLDQLSVGDYIPKDTIIQKSTAFDRYNNRTEGINMNMIYLNLDANMEDSVVMSDVAASKLTSPLIKPIKIMINDNDIPMNLYGDDNTYKVFPDIGEEVREDTRVIALRKEKKEEAYYAQDTERLKTITMSDDKRSAAGKVIDVNIYCSNPDMLDNYYYSQLKLYYNEKQRCAADIIHLVLPYVSQGCELTYDLNKLFSDSTRVYNKDKYWDKKPFSNTVIEIVVLEEKTMQPGDKCVNRYGGKGVISDIWPQKFMPRYENPDGTFDYADIIFNTSTMYGRENVGQMFEVSLNYISSEIVKKIKYDKSVSLQDAYNMIFTFMNACSPTEAEYLNSKVQKMTTDDLSLFISSIVEDGNIHLSMKPISESMTLDKLDMIYKLFPWIKMNDIEVPIEGSDGRIRYAKARRPALIGKQYIFRLEQFAEEKFSATSLSATNVKNENTKSRAKKDYKELFSNTPIRFGSMEINNMLHLGAEIAVMNLMIHSLSPQARRLAEQMYTEDPFNIDVRLDSDSKNRSAEIVNTFLKTIGRRLVFRKVPKIYKSVEISPVEFENCPFEIPVYFIPQEILKQEGFDPVKENEERQELERRKKEEGISPVTFDGRNYRELYK